MINTAPLPTATFHPFPPPLSVESSASARKFKSIIRNLEEVVDWSQALSSPHRERRLQLRQQRNSNRDHLTSTPTEPTTPPTADNYSSPTNTSPLPPPLLDTSGRCSKFVYA